MFENFRATAKYKNKKIVAHQAKAYADGEDGT